MQDGKCWIVLFRVLSCEENRARGNATGMHNYPLHHVRAGLPPMIWFVGTSDLIYDDNKRFCQLWAENGNECEFVDYEGMEHGFFNYGRHDNIPYYDTLKRMHNFMDSILQ